MKRKRKPFTLIELLIVISIIAILASMLLPALSKARNSANQIKCAGNLKQIALAIFQYGDDWSNYIPYLRDSNNVRWNDRVAPYLADEASGGIWQCPTLKYPNNGPLALSYGFNFTATYNEDTWASGYHSKLTEYKKPAQTFMAMDGYLPDSSTGAAWVYAEVSQTSFTDCVYLKCHNRKANVVMFDGHVNACNSNIWPNNWCKKQ